MAWIFGWWGASSRLRGAVFSCFPRFGGGAVTRDAPREGVETRSGKRRKPHQNLTMVTEPDSSGGVLPGARPILCQDALFAVVILVHISVQTQKSVRTLMGSRPEDGPARAPVVFPTRGPGVSGIQVRRDLTAVCGAGPELCFQPRDPVWVSVWHAPAVFPDRGDWLASSPRCSDERGPEWRW